MNRKAVLLVGSPREGRTASEALGEHLLGSIASMGFSTSSYKISKTLRERPDFDRMMEDMRSAGLIVLSFPLYFDSMPSDVIRLMELIRDDVSTDLSGRSFLAIGQCEHPDPGRLDIAISITRNFCESEGMVWEGGFRMPMGPTVEGGGLADPGSKGRNAIEALEIAASALADGKRIPEEAFSTMSRPPMSEMFYIMRANRRWKSIAKERGSRMDLLDKPCLR